MTAMDRYSDLAQNVDDLREQCLARIALLVGALGYAWFAGLGLFKERGLPIPSCAWVGAVLLLAAAAAGLALKGRHLHLAIYGLVCCSLAGTVCALLASPGPVTPYLLILPITFASVLLNQSAFLGFAGTAVLCSLAIGLSHTSERLALGHLPLPAYVGAAISHTVSSGLAVPVAVLLLVAATLWISSRSLYTALAWVWSGYESARRHEEVAQTRQAELKRALKALDEASFRLERANYMLTLARDQAEEARRLKQQFAQAISHELRTPLNLIVGFTELMARSPEYYGRPLAPAYLRDLGIVYRNACHVQTLINDVLDLARIEAAEMTIVPEEVDPAALVLEAVSTARSLVEARGLALRTEVEPGLPRLWIDPTRIRQVLFNLLNNAARFTEHGGVTVRAHRQAKAVVFCVSDTGVGIAAEDIPRIFEEFHQLDGGVRRQHDGTGLGLAVSRKFVELHGGRIWAESEVGCGSTFCFSLPTRRAEVDLGLGRQGPYPEKVLCSPQSEEPVLLAVTPSPSAAALLSRSIRGFRTVAVTDLAEAQRLAGQLVPQLVVIDRACAALSQEGLEGTAQAWGLPRTPFVACPLPGEEPLRQALDVDGYLIKPISRQALWDLLRQFGEDTDRVLVVDDDQDFVLFLSRILEDSPVRRYQVQSACSGREALALLDRHPPHLLLLDLKLPDISGREIIARVRSTPPWQHIPIVVVSAQGEADEQGSLLGAMAIAKAGGLVPGEVIRWVQNIADTATRAKVMPDGGYEQAGPSPISGGSEME